MNPAKRLSEVFLDRPGLVVLLLNMCIILITIMHLFFPKCLRFVFTEGNIQIPQMLGCYEMCLRRGSFLIHVSFSSVTSKLLTSKKQFSNYCKNFYFSHCFGMTLSPFLSSRVVDLW